MKRRIRYSVPIILFAAVSFFTACYGPERKALPSDAPDDLKEEATKCDKNDALSCHNLAIAYWRGEVVPTDIPKARELFSGACKAGAILSCEILQKIEPPENLMTSKTAGRIQLACKNGLPAACDTWAKLLLEAGHQDEALKIAQKQCHRTPSMSCTTAGRILHSEGKDTQAIKLLQRGCAQGIVKSCRYEAEIRMQGVEGEPSKKIFVLLTKACRGGDGTSCVHLADLYTNGMGSREDEDYASQLLVDACAYGVEDACNDEQPEETSN